MVGLSERPRSALWRNVARLLEDRGVRPPARPSETDDEAILMILFKKAALEDPRRQCAGGSSAKSTPPSTSRQRRRTCRPHDDTLDDGLRDSLRIQDRHRAIAKHRTSQALMPGLVSADLTVTLSYQLISQLQRMSLCTRSARLRSINGVDCIASTSV